MEFKRYQGDLEKCIAMANEKSLLKKRLYLVDSPQNPPYEPCSGAFSNHEVDLFGTSALCVGVSSVGMGQDQKTPLVSDSFASCVPVVAIGNTATHLAHCNSTTTIDEHSKSWQKTYRIMVIHGCQPRQAEVAKALANKLTNNLNFEDVDLVEVPITHTLGIVVIGTTAIAYPHP